MFVQKFCALIVWLKYCSFRFLSSLYLMLLAASAAAAAEVRKCEPGGGQLAAC